VATVFLEMLWRSQILGAAGGVCGDSSCEEEITLARDDAASHTVSGGLSWDF
jgi:hypothetical protein